MSAVLLARLISQLNVALSPELSLDPPICYTDSKIAYHWIQGWDKGWKLFVQNRVNEIRKLVQLVENWKHCSGQDNPADIPSRGLTLPEYEVWLHGPIWLKTKNVEDETHTHTDFPDECLKEQKKDIHELLTTQYYGISNLIDVERYSDIDHLLRVTTYVQVFIYKLQKLTVSNSQLLVRVETLWIKASQGSLSSHQLFEHWKQGRV